MVRSRGVAPDTRDADEVGAPSGPTQTQLVPSTVEIDATKFCGSSTGPGFSRAALAVRAVGITSVWGPARVYHEASGG